MSIRRAGALMILALAPVGGFAQDCQVTDLTPAFWRFWEVARDKPAAEQYRLFESIVREPNAAVYQGMFKGIENLDRLVPNSVAAARPHEAAMRQLSKQLASELPAHLKRFRAAFPDFQCSTPVYFVYSANAFDGAVRQVDGKPALLFGIDVVARLGNELAPLVAHELFHVHHRHLVPDAPDTVGWALWQEGLASYVSRQLNLDLPEEKACCLPPAAPVEAMLPRLASELRQHLDSEDETVYRRFFLGGQEQDIPVRSGYLVGYRVAAELGRTRTLQQLASLRFEALRPLIDQALLTLEAGSSVPPVPSNP
jgi:hypothetical protein